MAITLKKDASGYYDADQIVNLFEGYNLILHTNIGTIDTSIYNLCKKVTNTGMETAVINGTNGYAIDFAFNPTFTETTVDAIGENKLKPYEGKALRLPVRNIQKVTIKSKRNFLKNQSIAKKK